MKQYFIASVKEDYANRIDDIAASLKSRGCRISNVLKLTGVITGSVNEDIPLDELMVDGIASVEKQRVIRKKK